MSAEGESAVKEASTLDSVVVKYAQARARRMGDIVYVIKPPTRGKGLPAKQNLQELTVMALLSEKAIKLAWVPQLSHRLAA